MFSRISTRFVRPKYPLVGFRKFQSTIQENARPPVYDEALSYLESKGVPVTSVQNLESFRTGCADFTQSEFQKFGLDHFIRYRRDRVILFAKQRHVFSDFFPIADLNAEVHLASNDGNLIEFCKELPPSMVVELPQFHFQVYHPEERLYTFMFLDGDYPYPDLQRSREHVLWMITNMPLSASTSQKGDEVLPYIPPHPAKGTGAHRFITFLMEQPQPISLSPSRDLLVWDLVRKHALQPRGLHLFSAKWDSSVSSTFPTYLNNREPVFIDPPKLSGDGLEKDTYAVI